MGITYTPNLHLGMQLDKTDYVNWDAITTNWQIIDGIAPSSTGGSMRTMRAILNKPGIAGHTETFEQTLAMLAAMNDEQEAR